MGSMMHSASTLSTSVWKQLDGRLRLIDEDRWLSSRYAALTERRALTALYLLNHELARVRLVVTEAGLGAIRFQWWRDTLEQIGRGDPCRHETGQALAEQVEAERLTVPALLKLVDEHEAAFEANDRGLEPEARLTAMAAQIFAPAHGWGEMITTLAPHCAALRRGEKVGFGPVVARAPGDIRPAIAHFRLRRLMAEDRKSGGLARRLCVMRAVLGGRV